MAQHITEKMKQFIEARREFLQNNRPPCPGSANGQHQKWPGVNLQPSRKPRGTLFCDSPRPPRLIEQGTPPQWWCTGCNRSWTYEPEPPHVEEA